MAEVRIGPAGRADFDAIRQRLDAAGLPIEDLSEASHRRFLVARLDAAVVGTIAVETYGETGLLRSLTVASSLRGTGLGLRLLRAAETEAVRQGVRQLYHLTNSAADFFARHGYQRTDRQAAPAAIAATPPFGGGLCPADAAFLSKVLDPRPYTVLFLCTGNSARSILAEAVTNHLPGRPLLAYSAGSDPRGEVNPFALELLSRHGIPTAGLRSKRWDEFARPGAPALDVVITVCDQAAGETCPYWPGAPLTAHWGMPDPAAVEGSEAAIRAAFEDTLQTVRRRIGALAALPIGALGRDELRTRLTQIGQS